MGFWPMKVPKRPIYILITNDNKNNNDNNNIPEILYSHRLINFFNTIV